MLKFYLLHHLENEKIIMLLRRHWFIIFKKIALWTIVAILPLIFYFVAGDVLVGLLPPDLAYPISILFISIYYLYIWLFMFHSFVDYYF